MKMTIGCGQIKRFACVYDYQVCSSMTIQSVYDIMFMTIHIIIHKSIVKPIYIYELLVTMIIQFSE